MFKNVLVGVDGRPGGRDAIALASQLRDRDGSMTLVHVFGGLFMPTYPVDPARIEEEEREHAEKRLEQEHADAGVDAEVVVIEGLSAGRALHQEAERRGADLLVLGSCHRGSFGRAVLGDETRESLNGAPCAVAIAPAGYSETVKPLSTIGVGYDGSQESQAALELAKELAERTAGKVRALQIVHLPSYVYTGLLPPLIGEGIDELVKGANAEMAALGVDASAHYGLPGDDLAAFSKEVDLLITGSRAYGPIGRLIHGSTSNYLQRHARGPLLVLPRSRGRGGQEATNDGAASQAPVPA